MRKAVYFLGLICFFLIANCLPALAINSSYIGTWTGSAKLATQYGYLTKSVTVKISSTSSAVFKGSYNVQQGELTGNLTGSVIGKKAYFTGSYFVGEGTISWDSSKDKWKLVGCWQYVGSAYPNPYTAYFVIYK